MSESIPLDPDRDEGALDRGEPTREQVERRALEISQSDDAGTPEENWARAERELRGGDGG
ncbi:MAG: hypothetical protein ACRDNB_07285 [Gaiellaceae bacterium]